MKIEFPALESEPLIYFLFHSGTFVALLGGVFFMLGLWLAWLTWGRHKRANRALQEEVNGLQEEIISLKRKLAEQVMRTPPPRSVSVTTSPLVSMSAPMPAVNPLPSASVPEVRAAEKKVASSSPSPVQTVAAPSFPQAPALVSPAALVPMSNVAADHGGIAEAFPNLPSVSEEVFSHSGIRKGLARPLAVPLRTFKSAAEVPVPLVAPKPRRFPWTDDDGASDVEPFSFLMGPASDDDEEIVKPGSPLNSIIAPKSGAFEVPEEVVKTESEVKEGDEADGEAAQAKPGASGAQEA